LSQLGAFIEFQRDNASRADFVIVYLEEAHPTDGWMYESVTHFIKQHTSLEERCDAAKVLGLKLRGMGKKPITLVVDTLSNSASLAYGALPERLVILQAGAVRFIGGKGPESYSVDDARRALHELLASS